MCVHENWKYPPRDRVSCEEIVLFSYMHVTTRSLTLLYSAKMELSENQPDHQCRYGKRCHKKNCKFRHGAAKPAPISTCGNCGAKSPHNYQKRSNRRVCDLCWNSFHEAVRTNRIDVVDSAVQSGHFTDAINNRWGCETPLMTAANKGYCDLMHILMMGGADIHYRCPDGSYEGCQCLQKNVFHEAVLHNQFGAADMLLQWGIDVNSIAACKLTAFHMASMYNEGNIDQMRYLCRRGANTELKNDWGQTWKANYQSWCKNLSERDLIWWRHCDFVVFVHCVRQHSQLSSGAFGQTMFNSDLCRKICSYL
jgi:hypothetical protein